MAGWSVGWCVAWSRDGTESNVEWHGKVIEEQVEVKVFSKRANETTGSSTAYPLFILL